MAAVAAVAAPASKAATLLDPRQPRCMDAALGVWGGLLGAGTTMAASTEAVRIGAWVEHQGTLWNHLFRWAISSKGRDSTHSTLRRPRTLRLRSHTRSVPTRWVMKHMSCEGYRMVFVAIQVVFPGDDRPLSF